MIIKTSVNFRDYFFHIHEINLHVVFHVFVCSST